LRLIGTNEEDIATWPEQESTSPRGELGMTISEKRWHAMHREGRLPPRHLRLNKDTAQPTGGHGMQALRFTEQFRDLFTLAVQMTSSAGAEAIMLLLDGPADWSRLRTMAGKAKLIVAADTADQLEGAKQGGIPTVQLDMPDSPMYERLTQSVLEAVADDLLASGSAVVALYSGFDADSIDSLSVINLDEHLNRLTGRDLRQLETRVPLDTLKIVVDLAVEIGREGREGKPVGTLFVVGDSRKVLTSSRPVGFDPVRGYSRKERNLNDSRVREGIKEIAQMDGAIIVSAEGVVEAACRYLDCSAADVTLSKGLGARHWAAAAISRATNAIAVSVSQSNGTVRIFHNGEVVLRIEPYLRRPMVWKGFEHEPPTENKPKRGEGGE
jgi:DNA integrity scanning protein DisA with diadenylate cyclase activity